MQNIWHSFGVLYYKSNKEQQVTSLKHVDIWKKNGQLNTELT